MKSNRFIEPVLVVALLLLSCSCASTSEAIYFNNIQASEFADKIETLEPPIQENDLLSITISSLNPDASEMFNVSSNNSIRNANATNTISPVFGYLVERDGYIQLPLLGSIKAAGLTKEGLKNKIRQEIVDRKLLLNPIIDIRYLNYKVSVLGEVARPSVLTVPNEKLTFLEALGLAGDLTIYAKRDNILLIREEEGKRVLTRIDLTTNELFTSPYYYLRSNDIIYVEPNKTKIASAGALRQWLPIALSSLTLVVVSIDRLTR